MEIDIPLHRKLMLLEIAINNKIEREFIKEINEKSINELVEHREAILKKMGLR